MNKYINKEYINYCVDMDINSAYCLSTFTHLSVVK